MVVENSHVCLLMLQRFTDNYKSQTRDACAERSRQNFIKGLYDKCGKYDFKGKTCKAVFENFSFLRSVQK